MTPSIWQDCQATMSPVHHVLHRLVESQEQVATTHLVGLERQGILEDMLERTKPAIPPAARAKHYLLSTPFRYPPLRHGSRFGSRFEPSIFYGAHTAHTALAESAYYRHYFWRGMVTPPASPIVSQHLLFTAIYQAERGCQLQKPPFREYEMRLRHPRDYTATQALGGDMRAAGVLAFEYVSARDLDKGLCVGLFDPQALLSTAPESSENWLCQTDASQVQFRHRQTLKQFPLSMFLHGGTFPVPA